MGMDFGNERVVDLARRVRTGEVTATALAEHSLAMIEERNADLNAFVAVDPERALDQAAAIDQLVEAGGDPGPLAGIPIGVKDLEDAMGFPTTFGSPLFDDAPPADLDSVLVARLRQAGCVVVGKTNTPEFGCSASTSNNVFGTTSSPWNLEHSPGGSSGGSGAAIAGGLVPLATGSDGGGSIRIPSAACGLSGMKTSLGRIPNGGAHAPSWLTLSHKGPMARHIADVAFALDVAIGPDPTDLRSLPKPEASFAAAVEQPHFPGRVAWSPTLGFTSADNEVIELCERALDVIADMGVEIDVIDGPFHVDPTVAWGAQACSGLAATTAPFQGDPRFERCDPTVKFMTDYGQSLSAINIVESFEVAHQLNLDLVQLFHGCRLLLTPTTAAVAPPHALGGAAMINGEPDQNWARFTQPFNLTGSPAATVAVGLSSSGVPVGLQIVGPQHADLAVLRAAAALEEAIGFEAIVPKHEGWST
jgi:aspartyl-tRNA(Asn)/glutamyl-tRNA(Gln) amidotransferase subunit A